MEEDTALQAAMEQADQGQWEAMEAWYQQHKKPNYQAAQMVRLDMRDEAQPQVVYYYRLGGERPHWRRWSQPFVSTQGRGFPTSLQ